MTVTKYSGEYVIAYTGIKNLMSYVLHSDDSWMSRGRVIGTYQDTKYQVELRLV